MIEEQAAYQDALEWERQAREAHRLATDLLIESTRNLAEKREALCDAWKENRNAQTIQA